MSENMLVLIYTIHTHTYLLWKTSKERLLLPVVNLDKASVCGDRKTSFSFWQKQRIGIHIYRDILLPRREGVKGGAISGVLHIKLVCTNFRSGDI